MLISALMIGFSSAYASAAGPVWLLRAKAGIAAAMMAANIVFEPLQAAQGQALADVIDPLNIVQTVSDTSWDSYIDQSVIVVRPDYVTIDGESYSEIWLGPDAADALRASGFDFTTAYNIVSNQSQAVSYAEGQGYCAGLPCYLIDNEVVTPTYTFSGYGLAQLGDISVTVSQNTGSYPYLFHSDYNGVTAELTSKRSELPFNVRVRPSQTDGQMRAGSSVERVWNSARNYTKTLPNSAVVSPFEFDYTSGVIDVPLDPEDGLLLRVPSSYDSGDPDSPYNYDIPGYVNSYPDVNNTNGRELIFDPSLNPDFDVDLGIGNALGDLITAVILAKLADLLGNDSEVIYAPMPEKDEPVQPGIIDPLPDPDPAPVDPVPGTTIADTDWIKLDEILRWIQSTIDSIRHLTESLQTMLDSIFDAIQSVIQQIAEIPEAIRELADKILEDIELGPSKLFDKALDILKTLFLPLLLPIRAMMNLWHYVVEWIQSISSPFTWIFGIMSATSANMVLPIYALLAGGICISIYKALGR